MTRRSPTLLAFALLACASAQAAPKKKHPPVAAKETAAQAATHEDIDVDAMARAKDGKPTDPPPEAPEASAAIEPTPAVEATAPAEPAAATPDASTKAADAPGAPTTGTAAPAKAMDDASMGRPSPLAPASEATNTDKSIAAGCESRAKGLLDAAQKGDYAGATRDFDAKMRTALPPPKFKQAWESLAQFGTLQGRGQAHPMKGEGYIAITVPLIFDKANLYAQVACGSDGRIAGFYIKPL